MRVLLIDAREGGDWGLDLLYSGLVRNLGPENVVDLPDLWKHRMGVPKLIGDAEKDWGAERMSLSYVPEHDRIPSFDHHEVRRMLAKGEIDLIFLDERQESYNLYLSLGARICKTPVVVVAGHDRFWNNSPEFVKFHYYPQVLRHMFLDNWRPEYEKLPFASRYSWSANFDHLWDQTDRARLLAEKVYDLSFMGYNSHPNRARYVDHILKHWGHLKTHIVLERRPNTMDAFVPKREYFRVMAQSRICLNLRGAAENGKALRFYEIPYVGSFMLSEAFSGHQQAGFQHGKHCQFFWDEDDLDLEIAFALQDNHSREQIATRGHEHLMSGHTAEQRVKDMLATIT